MLGKMKVTYKITSDQTDDALGLYEVTLQPGIIGASPHLHRRLTEIFQVIEGSLVVLLGKRNVSIGPGDLVRVPPGTVHAFANCGAAPVVFLLIFTPALRREGFFEKLAALAPTGRLENREALLEIFSRFDQDIAEGPQSWPPVSHLGGALTPVWQTQ